MTTIRVALLGVIYWGLAVGTWASVTLAEDAAQKLKSLPANRAVLLGSASVVGEFNDVARQFELHKTGPRGRDFTIKMVWAPERQRALFCGANHAVPHRLNDVWEFDSGRSNGRCCMPQIIRAIISAWAKTRRTWS